MNNSDGKASLKRQKSPENTTDTRGMSKFYPSNKLISSIKSRFSFKVVPLKATWSATVEIFRNKLETCQIQNSRSSCNWNNSDGKASLKRQRTPETTTEKQDVSRFCSLNV